MYLLERIREAQKNDPATVLTHKITETFDWFWIEGLESLTDQGINSISNLVEEHIYVIDLDNDWNM